MTTLIINKKYGIVNGTNKLLNFKVKSLKSNFVTGYTWHIVFENGQEYDLLAVSRGKNRVLKEEMKVQYE